MSENTADHEYAPDAPAVPAATFQEPEIPGAVSYMDAMAVAARADDFRRHQLAQAAPQRVAAVAAKHPAPAPAEQPAGPVPVLEGTFAIFVTPTEEIVVAYRPRGADDDKRFVVPAFVVRMATQQSGHTPTEIFEALKEGM